MNEDMRLLGLRLMVGVQGAMLVAIGFFDAHRIIGFASGFGLVMLILALAEPALARMRGRMNAAASEEADRTTSTI